MSNDFSWMLFSPSSVIEISQEEFFLFHRIDRELYAILVFHLSRPPSQSIRILAFWIWLERVGYGGMIQKVLRLVPPVINEVADEALTCWDCIAREAFFAFKDIPVTKRLMDKEFSLEILHRHRNSALVGVNNTVHDVCLKAVGDLAHEALLRNNTMMLGPRDRR